MSRGPLPQDPAVRALIAQARQAQLTRRGLMGGAGALSLAAFLAACSGRVGGSGPAASATAGEDLSASQKTLTWANWSFYLDEDDDGNHPTLEAFMEQAGLTVDYDVVDRRQQHLLREGRDQLALGQDIGADAVCLTDWMVSHLDPLRLHAGVRRSEDARTTANLTPSCRTSTSTPAGPTRCRGSPASPVSRGTRRSSRTACRRVEDLWKPELNGRIGVLSEMRDTIGLIMLEPGRRHLRADWGDDEFQKRARRVRRAGLQRPDPQHQGQLVRRRPEERATPWRRSCWSGDITAINYEVGDKFASPCRTRAARCGATTS